MTPEPDRSSAAPCSDFFIKICGVTTAADAHMVFAAGATAIGVNLYPRSPRFVPLENAAPWLTELSGKILRVAVVVNAAPADLSALKKAGCFDLIQFHGDESPEFCVNAGFPRWIKAIRAADRPAAEEGLSYPAEALLLDSHSPGQYGGTGRRVDWDMVRGFVADHPQRRIILAGGLSPNNVGDAIRIVRPAGVDTASGVEIAPGQKDPYLVQQFIAEARRQVSPEFNPSTA